jgi:ribosome-associated heat shock protein Hsp15
VRGPAAKAQELYRETEESKTARAKFEEEKKMLTQFEALPVGRPSKKQRRDINKARGRVIGF